MSDTANEVRAADPVNQKILGASVRALNARPSGPRVGDYLRVGDTYQRFTHDWGDRIQAGGGGASYYLQPSGYVSYSGALNPGVSVDDVVLTEETRDGDVWFFDKDWARADGGVHYAVPFRVYVLREGTDTSGLF